MTDLPPHRVAQALEAPLLEVLIEPPALHLGKRLVELLARDRLIDETLAAAERRKIPRVMGLELARHRELPQRQVPRQIGIQRLLGAVERAQIGAHDA